MSKLNLFGWLSRETERLKVQEWKPKTRKRYLHRAFVVSHINPETECEFIFKNEEDQKAFKKATEKAISQPEVILDKFEKPHGDGWIYQ